MKVKFQLRPLFAREKEFSSHYFEDVRIFFYVYTRNEKKGLSKYNQNSVLFSVAESSNIIESFREN